MSELITLQQLHFYGTKRRVLTVEEQSRFLEYIHDNNQWKRYEPLFIVGRGTGMRIRELLALTWRDI